MTSDAGNSVVSDVSDAHGASHSRSSSRASTRSKHRRRGEPREGYASSDHRRSSRKRSSRSSRREEREIADALTEQPRTRRSRRASVDLPSREPLSALVEESGLSDDERKGTAALATVPEAALPVDGSSTSPGPGRRFLGLGILGTKMPQLRARADTPGDPDSEAVRRDKALQAEQAREANKAREMEKAQQREAEREKKKQAAYVAKQQKLSEKARKLEAKQLAKEESRMEKQAKQSELLMEQQRLERERELASMDRKQKRLLAITPFRRRHPRMEMSILTPVQRHALVKALVQLQIQDEWMGLGVPGALGLYGFPFSTERVPIKQRSQLLSKLRREREPVPSSLMPADEPLLLRHMFQVHLRQLPGLKDAPLTYWRKRVQQLNEMYIADVMATSREQSQLVLSHLLSLVSTQYMGMFFARGVGVRGVDELRGPGLGEPGTERWGAGKGWGAGTVKRGLARPYVLTDDDYELVDSLFDGEERKIWLAAGRESERVQGDFNALKEKLIEQEDGLEDIVSYLSVSQVGNLPVELQNAEEWVRIHIALVMRWLLVESPAADTLFKVIRVVHSLVPYWAVRQALMVANAQTMIQILLSILLAQPLGADSLFQRIIGYAIGREVSTIQKTQVEPLRKQVSESLLVSKVEAYVRGRTTEQVTQFEKASVDTGHDFLTTVLLSPIEPVLDASMRNHVLSMQSAYAASPYRANPDLAYPPSTPQGKDRPPIPSWGAPPKEVNHAREFALLKLLLRALLEKHDRARLAKLLSSNVTVNFIKDSLTHVFYDAIREVSKTADLSGRLGDLQKLIDDMIDVRKNTNNEIELWIELATKHHEFVYFFVHEMAPILQPVWQWCQYALDYMSLSTTDPQRPADRRAQNIEVNLDEMLQDERLSDSDVDQILREMDAVVEYSRWSKIRREINYRSLFLLSKTPSPTGLSHEALPNAAMKEAVRDVDGLVADAMDKDGVPLDDGSLDAVRGSERKDVPWAFFDRVDPLGQSISAEPASRQFRLPRPRLGIRPPALLATRKLLPLFRELMIAELPDWLDEDVNGEPRRPPEDIAKGAAKLLRVGRS